MMLIAFIFEGRFRHIGERVGFITGVFSQNTSVFLYDNYCRNGAYLNY